MEHLNILKLMEFVAQLKGGYKACQQYIKKSDNSQGRKLLKFWDHIENCKGKYTDSQEDRMEVHTILFGKKIPYSAKKIQTLMAQLRRIVVQFIRTEVMEESSLGQLLLAGEYRKSGLAKLADKALESSIGKANVEKGTMAKLVRSLAYRHQYDIGKRIEDIPKGKLEMSDVELDNFYFEQKLYSLLNTSAALRLDKNKIDYDLRHKINRVLEQIPPNSSGLIKIQEKALRHFLEPSPENYFIFKKAYFSLVDQLEVNEDKSNLLIFLVNAIIVLESLDMELRMEYVVLYKFGLKNNLLTENGKISGLRYDNIIFSAEFVGDYEFIKEVVERLGSLIVGEKVRKRSLLLSKAYELFGKGKFREAIAKLRMLQNAKDVPYYFFLRKHLLVLKCLYEQEVHSFDAFINIKSERSAFYGMLSRYVAEEYIDEVVRNSYINFYLLLRGIAHRGIPKKSLQNQLESFGSEIVELKWLKEKLADRKK